MSEELEHREPSLEEKTAKKMPNTQAKKTAKKKSARKKSASKKTAARRAAKEESTQSEAIDFSKPVPTELARKEGRDEKSSSEERGSYKKNRDFKHKKKKPNKPNKPIELTGPEIEVEGLLETATKGFGFLRVSAKGFTQASDDIFVPPDLIRKNQLRACVWVKGKAKQGPKGIQMVSIDSINDQTPEEARVLPVFEDLKAVNPNRRISFETEESVYTTRVLDMVAPVGRGQRGLIVAPPRAGKTTLLLNVAQGLMENYSEDIHLIILLVDERPEEVTDFKRKLPNAEIYSSSNDSGARNHCRVAELCIERSKRLVEAGKDVFVLMDSITRLARAYNNQKSSSRNNKGRGYQSGGLAAGALEVPRRLFAAARNTREAGSLTILATALIQTNSKADEAIFQEFKGTGNMELVLDRRIAEQYVYPAIDIFKSGTRRDELLLPEHQLEKISKLRRGLAGSREIDAIERLLFFIKKFPTNAQMLLQIK